MPKSWTGKHAKNAPLFRALSIGCQKFTSQPLLLKIQPEDSFITYRFKFEETNIKSLTLEELNSIIQKDFSIERLSTVKDIFFFQCFSGLAFSDIEQLKPEHLVKDINNIQVYLLVVLLI